MGRKNRNGSAPRRPSPPTAAAQRQQANNAGQPPSSSSSSSSSSSQQRKQQQSTILSAVLSFSSKSYRFLLVAVVLLSCNYTREIYPALVHRFLPYGPAAYQDLDKPKALFATIDASNTLLQLQHGRTAKIFERFENNGTASSTVTAEEPLLKAPETVLFDKDGTMYLMTEEAKLIKLSDFEEGDQSGDEGDEMIVTAKTSFVRDLGCGRPLGGAFAPNNGFGRKKTSTLYIADAVLGLTRIHNIHDPKSKLEVVVSSVPVEEEENDSSINSNNNQNKRRKRLLYVDDVVVGPKSGKVYFTDASDIPPPRSSSSSSSTWNTLYASKLDLIRNKATGSVYEYNPSTEQVRLLTKGLRFANGISVDPDERFLVVAETFGPRLLKYHLQGNRAGQVEVLIPDHLLPGYPDGVDCDPFGTYCYAVMPSAIAPIHKLLLKLPPRLDQWLRTLLLMLPPSLAPPVAKYGAVAQVDLLGDTTNDAATTLSSLSSSSLLTLIQDPTGKDLSMLCGVTWHDHKLYFGSVHNNYIGVYHLSPPIPW